MFIQAYSSKFLFVIPSTCCNETGNRPIFFLTLFPHGWTLSLLGTVTIFNHGTLGALLYSIFTWDIFLYFSLSTVHIMVASGDSFVVTWQSGSCQAHWTTTMLLGTWPRASSCGSQPHHMTVSLTPYFTFYLTHNTLLPSPLLLSSTSNLYSHSMTYSQLLLYADWATLCVPYSTLPYSLLLDYGQSLSVASLH